MRDEIVLGVVVTSRFLVPLAILRYPLPGILGAILADGDRVILHAYTNVPLDDYQVYDKAFDIYYLSIAYVATLRNWRDPTAITIGRLLWLYRLFGVALFALIGDHRLLFIFPAAFEFFFVLYEAFRTRWAPERLAGMALLMMAATAWTLKLPQEYWLHVARHGTTAWIERNILHPDPSVRDLLVVLATAIGVGVTLRWARVALRLLPPADHSWQFGANTMLSDVGRLAGPTRTARGPRSGLVEKLALVTLLGMMFAEFAPGLDESTVQVGLGLAFLVIGNAVISMRFVDQSGERRSAAGDVAATCALNAPIVLSLMIAAQWVNASIAAWSSVCLVLLASLLIGLHDRYHDTYRQLLAESHQSGDP
jgi:hypothetical protein